LRFRGLHALPALADLTDTQRRVPFRTHNSIMRNLRRPALVAPSQVLRALTDAWLRDVRADATLQAALKDAIALRLLAYNPVCTSVRSRLDARTWRAPCIDPGLIFTPKDGSDSAARAWC
jgi:hypothetical protein